jgi:hypothetical protein
MVFDDIRQENNGKPFIIGVYQQAIIFPSLPVTVPQLLVGVTLFSDIKNPITQYTVHITGPGIDLSQEVGPIEMAPSEYHDATRAEVSWIVYMRPFTATGPGVLDIMVEFSGSKVRARRLRIHSVESLAAAHPGTQPTGKPH